MTELRARDKLIRTQRLKWAIAAAKMTIIEMKYYGWRENNNSGIYNT